MADTTTNGEIPPEIAAALQRVGKVDQGKFKLWELEDLEDTLGMPVASYINEAAPPVKFMRGLLWLWLRRSHPELRFDDLRGIDLDTLSAAFGVEEEPESLDPTGAASIPPATPASSISATSPGSATSGT